MLRHNLLHLLLLVAVLCAYGDSDSNPTAPVATPGTNESATETTPPDTDAEAAAETTEVLTERGAGLRSLRDLTFGPTDSGLDDELFVVHFEGVEATWVQAIDSTPVLRRFENSLVGAVALDANGGLFVFNRGSRSVVRIDFADGVPVDRHAVQIIAENLAVTEQILPSHLFLDDAGRLFISETAANRVLVWSAGELETFTESRVSIPTGIAQLPAGNLVIANHGDGTLTEFSGEGDFLRIIDTGLGDRRLLSIAVRGDGVLFAVDDNGSSSSVYEVNLD